MRNSGLAVPFLAGLLLLAACSLAAKKSRPDAAAENVLCALEYQPSTSGSGPDLLFLAWSSPYRAETFYMSPPDALIHSAFAPGRHLTKDARIEGATCSPRPWRKGFRLPPIPASKKWLLCTRTGLEEVLFQVETQWGKCTQRIPPGDTTPRDLGGLRNVKELPELGGGG